MQFMSRAPSALDYRFGDGRPMLVQLEYNPQTKALQRLVLDIQNALATGSAVLVRGWEPEPRLDFTMEDLRLYRPTLAQTVDVQGA